MFDFKNIKIKAVLLSLLTYVASSAILGAVLSIFTSFQLMKNFDMQDPEQQKAFGAALLEDTTYVIGMVVATLIAGFLGGFVAGKVAKVAQLTNAVITAVIMFVIGLILYFAFPQPINSMNMAIMSWVAMLVGFYGGGYLTTPETEEVAQ